MHSEKFKKLLKLKKLVVITTKKGKGGGKSGVFILDPSRSTILTYEWGLGRATNNQVNHHALYLGLDCIVSLGIQKVVILGDCNTPILTPRGRGM